MKKFLSEYRYQVVAVLFIIALAVFRLIFTPMIIQTGSMAVDDGPNKPGLQPGAIVFVMKWDGPLKPTDIITFQQEGQPHPITHTFIGYADDGSLMTKGDANPVPDTRDVPLQRSDVIGKVMWTLPFFTQFYWTSVRGVLSLIVLALVAISITVVLVRGNKKGLPLDTPQEETLASTPA